MKNILFGLSVIVNLIAFAAVFWGIFAGGTFKLFVYPKYMRDLSQFGLLKVQPGDTVFLGDSITEGGKWSELFPHSNVCNRGIIGDITTGIIERLEQVSGGKPAQVFLMAGINDLSMNTSQEVVVKNIVTIVDKICESSPDTKVFVQSILPNKARLKNKIESTNAELEKAIEGKARWVNLYPLFLDEAGVSMNDTLSNDKAHLLGQGYIVWRDAIADLVNKSK